MNYKAKLNDLRWRAFRAIILERDGFACTQCGAQHNLHVHHLAYRGEPWEAETTDVITLCYSCHRKVHGKREKLKYLGEFHFMYGPAVDKLARTLPQASTTFFRLSSGVEKGNKLYIDPKKLALTLGMPKSTFDDHFKALCKMGALIPELNYRRRASDPALWLVCPLLAWKGSIKNLEAYLKKLPKDHVFFSFQESMEKKQA